MCQVKCTIEPGLIPAERVARFRTVDGRTEEVVVSPAQVAGQTFAASEISRQGHRVLIELPRESMSGRWRVWIGADQLGAAHDSH